MCGDSDGGDIAVNPIVGLIPVVVIVGVAWLLLLVLLLLLFWLSLVHTKLGCFERTGFVGEEVVVGTLLDAAAVADGATFWCCLPPTAASYVLWRYEFFFVGLFVDFVQVNWWRRMDSAGEASRHQIGTVEQRRLVQPFVQH